MIGELMGGTVVLAAFLHYFFGITMTLTAVFLILLVLVQRGRGGGLAGALGGMGGQSAFGTKAGDTFTRITIGAAICWLLLCVASVKFLGNSEGAFGRATPPDETQLVPGPAAGSTELPIPGQEATSGAPSSESIPPGTPDGGAQGNAAPADQGGTSSAAGNATAPDAGNAEAEVTSGADVESEATPNP